MPNGIVASAVGLRQRTAQSLSVNVALATERDCIYEYAGPSDDRLPNQLYIDPEECIDCQACEPVCPREAPLRDSDVPVVFEDDIALNALVLEHKEQFVVPAHTDKPQPAPDEVTANRRKWS
jgi:ferredoxin